MSCSQPTGGGEAVALDLPDSQRKILRGTLTMWLDGVREDLETPNEVQHPDQAWQEAQAFARLLDALTTGKICLPDESARATIEASAAAHDKESEYTEVAATHDALHALLGVLGGPHS